MGIFVVNNTMREEGAMYLPFLLSYLRSKRVSYKVVTRSADLARVRRADITGVIISGSPLMVTKESVVPNLDQYLLNIMVALRFDVPIMGICFGCQLINTLYGGRLRKLRTPFCEDAKVYIGGKGGGDARFCLSYVIQDVSQDFEVLGSAMVRRRLVPCLIKHKERPIYGCLFHPEFHAGTHWILERFLGECFAR